MHIAQRIQSITLAPMDEINTRVAALGREGAQVINLGQGVPGFPPATGAIHSARQALPDSTTHVYSADAGILSLRRMVSVWLAEQNQIEADPDPEMFITAGANQAFMVALLTLLEPGDGVLLPSPFYFNHEMSKRVAGGVPLGRYRCGRRQGFSSRWRNWSPTWKRSREPSLSPLPTTPQAPYTTLRSFGASPASRSRGAWSSSPMRPTRTSFMRGRSTSAWPQSLKRARR